MQQLAQLTLYFFESMGRASCNFSSLQVPRLRTVPTGRAAPRRVPTLFTPVAPSRVFLVIHAEHSEIERRVHPRLEGFVSALAGVSCGGGCQ